MRRGPPVSVRAKVAAVAGPWAVLVEPASAAALQMPSHANEAYAWMFLVLASMPYILLAVIGGGIYRANKRAREREVERLLEEQRAWEGAAPEAEPE